MVRWTDAAINNPILPAAELYFISRPEERVPWRQLLSSPITALPGTWGRRQRRSSYASVTTNKDGVSTATLVSEEKTPPRKVSPKSPLSWSPCEIGGTRRDSSVKKRPAPVGSGGLDGGGTRVGGSIKIVAELKECERSLLEKNMVLRKEVNDQKLAQSALIQENKRLKSLEAKLQHHVVAETMVSDMKAEHATHEERHFLPFDLNMPAPSDLDCETIYGGGFS